MEQHSHLLALAGCHLFWVSKDELSSCWFLSW